MLSSEVFSFLSGLKRHNHKSWFDANRRQYETARKAFTGTVEELIKAISAFDPSVGTLKASDCIFRINRDIRFSKDKSPYKTNMGAFINPGGRKSDHAGYYFHIEPGKSFAAGGAYMPGPDGLAKLRQEIDYHFDEWKNITGNRTFKQRFPEGVDGIETLARPPKGYEAGNPAIVYLKMKSYIVSCPFTDAQLTGKSALKELVAVYKTMHPMVAFLNRSLE